MQKVEESELEQTINFFTENILDEKIHRYFFPDNNTYNEKVGFLYKFYCNFHFNDLYKSDDGNAIVICHPPTKKLVTPSIKDAYGISYAAKVGIREIVRLISFQMWLNNFKSSFLQKPHYYLDSIAVKDNELSSESFKEIITSITSIAKSEGINVFLEVYIQELANDFCNLGFNVAKEVFIPNSDLKAYCLLF